jgi:type IV pilus assembly protein PilB
MSADILKKIDQTVLSLIPSSYALEHKIIPLEIEKDCLKVAMVNGQDFALMQDIMLLTSRNVTPVEMAENRIIDAIVKNYKIKLLKNRGLEQVKEFKLVDKVQEEYKEKIEIKDDLSVINEINKIVTEAVNQGSSDIHFEPYERFFRVRYRKDGALQDVKHLALDKKFAYISRLKIMAELDIAEKRRPQDGRIRMAGGKRIVDIRVSTMPTDFGEKVVLRLLDKSSFKLDLDNIGFTKNMKTRFENVLQSPFGMILVTGPTGSGKTTTLYTALSSLNKTDVNIMTIEDPIEYNLEGINQGHVRADIGFTFANALRSFLRQDPDIIMVGEIRDSETAEIAIRSALTGHLVLSTLHTNDAPSAITRLVDMGIEPFLVATSLKLVMAQRLVKKICTHCKTKYNIDTGLLKRLGFDDNNNKFYKGKGCDYCNDTGYSGRTAVIEMLPITEKISELIMNNASAARIRKTAVQEGMLTLREHGIMKLKEGETTIDEVMRETMI